MRHTFVSFCLLVSITAVPAMACEADGVGHVSEADFLEKLDLTGLTYAQQVAVQQEALIIFRLEQQALIDKAREEFKARFKPRKESAVSASRPS
ncbi:MULTISPECIES: hypothetical protein [unclassified Sphingobium]|uniref:hypothetical protein n=1 Tax=unclassified Sphingobium TaxID=2611147 RepID=UPI002224E958|nr:MULTISPECIES: hypothetical protein [unclassified Sphingobium]MCW2413324.1 hypothetical protein [Sphingobium sp. B8D3D]MCW2414377.1 hypothetical protein [Sphingobium sp. B8D3A]